MTNTKKCTKCGEEKFIDLFYNNESSKDGKYSQCKLCKSKYYKIRNADTEIKNKKQITMKKWYEENKEIHKNRCRAYVEVNKKEIKAKTKTRWDALTEEEKAIRRKKRQELKKKNPNYRAIKACRRRLARYVQKKTSNTVELLGCSPIELRLHLESLWMQGMSWDNYGLEGWHIDHKLPITSFNLSCPEQVKKCFHYTNLQPLWAKDNLSKGAKII